MSAPTNVVEKHLITIVMPASSSVYFSSFVKFNEFYRLTTAARPSNGNGTISGICLMDNNPIVANANNPPLSMNDVKSTLANRLDTTISK